MDRIHNVVIAGNDYPLNFSVGVAAKVIEKYGDLSGINTALGLTQQEEANNWVELCRNITWLLDLMLRAGAAYQRAVGQGAKLPPDMEALEVLLSPWEMMELRIPILEAITAGMRTTIEVDPPKNAEATQN